MYSNDFSSPEYTDKDAPHIPYEHFYNDIITPLSIMYINIQWLENGNLRKDAVIRHVESIKNNWFQIMKLINDTCDGRRILSGTLRPTFHNQDLVSVVKDIADSAALLSERRNIRLEFLCSAPQCIVATDKRIAQRIILNMLSQAFRRTEENGNVTMEVVLDGDNLVVEVKDCGPEVSEYLMERLKPLLNQESGAVSQNLIPQGYMWLVIIRQLAGLIGASLSYEPAVSGLTIALSVPIAATTETEADKTLQDIFYSDNIYQFELNT